jgi:quercetin dioxygenase-like cupin family protein
MRTPLKTVRKPWGREIWFAHTPLYVGKILFLKRGHRLSKQYHRFKDETVYTDSGRYWLEVNGRGRVMRPGSVVRFRPGTVHRMEARFGDVRLLEVSTPQVGDVVRLEDDYRRVGGARRGRPARRRGK